MRSTRFVLGLAAVLFVWNLWGHDLWAPDEPYFAEGAREMLIDGEWTVPHVNGIVTTDKPPLFFWLIALFSAPFGRVLEFTARLPSVLAALGTLWLTMRLGRRWFDERTGAIAGLVLTTNYLFWDKARTAQIDSLLCFLILAAITAFEAFRAGDADGRRAGLCFWLATALAVLAKGPVGLLLPLGVALITLAIDGSLSSWRRFAPFSGPLLFLTLVAGWGIGATAFSGGEYSVLGALQEHFVDRAISGMHHAQPFWYYAKVLPVQLSPWSALVPGALLLAWKRRDPGERFLLVWCVFVVLFFSIPTEKRDLYVLPAYPAFALLVGSLIAGLTTTPAASQRRTLGDAWLLVPQGITGAFLVLVGLIVFLAGDRTAMIPFPVRAAIGVTAISFGCATLLAAILRKRTAVAFLPAAGAALLYIIASSAVFPALNAEKSARAFSERIRQVTGGEFEAGKDVLAFNLRNLPEAFAFYSDGLYLLEIHDLDEMTERLSEPCPVYAVMDLAAVSAFPDDVARSLHTIDSARLARKDVAIVVNCPAPG